MKKTKFQQHNVTVIMAFKDGHDYVADQVKSIFEQTHKNISLEIYDDSSANYFSLNLLPRDTAINLKKIKLFHRPKSVGHCRNFLDSLRDADNNSDFFAFSDQDDIWNNDKIERALTSLGPYANSPIPVLYCSRTEIVDKNGKKNIGFSPEFKYPPSFSNALIQNIAGGNTIVLNKSAKQLIVKASQNIQVPAHDWWCYLIVTGAGGVVIYDKTCTLKYRQHGKNSVGANVSLLSKLQRLKSLFLGNLKKWNNQHIFALNSKLHLLEPKNQKLLADFECFRANNSLLTRCKIIFSLGVNRQTVSGNIALFLAIIFKKV